MKRVIDFGDKNYIDLPTEKIGLFIRLYISNWEDGTWWTVDAIKDLPEGCTPCEYFKVNDKIKGIFYILK